MTGVEYAELRLVNGETLKVGGALSAVEKELSDAARSGSSRFAWLIVHETGEPVGVNPDHVVSLRLRESRD